jgi:hypothetical protein
MRLTPEQKRNILARLQAIRASEWELQQQRAGAFLGIMNTEEELEELRREKNEIIEKLIKNV